MPCFFPDPSLTVVSLSQCHLLMVSYPCTGSVGSSSSDTSARTLFVREGGREDVRPDVHVTSNVELSNNVRLLLNVDLRNYVISSQIVI